VRKLIILTGPSHSGKTSVARALVRELRCPTGHVEIDKIMEMLSLGDLDHWEHGLPVAYDIAAAATETLLLHDFVVVFDSTFTFIPSDGREGQWHAEQLARLQQLGRKVGAPVAMVQLRASLPELLRRRALTGRLSDPIVEGVWKLHESFSDTTEASFVLATDDVEPEDLEQRVGALAHRIVEGISGPS
jgi:predicted kinase